MIRLHERHPDPNATWKDLTPAERKRAKRLKDWVLDASLDISPQGRPADVDGALVLYCARLIGEACRRPFRFSRPGDGDAPGGPMWRALIAALEIAQSHLMRVEDPTAQASTQGSSHAEAIAAIVKTTRTKRFAEKCRWLGIGDALIVYSLGSHDACPAPA